ncbi:hypothetical protein GIB67_003735 [Kingdonia uniflora]|uniref:Uncharacterized protein n=1 Tax=Kingdonia uniflora TaxID=39325 RepID=A0A7J7MSF2_9MAGN|nr:hypothetical protein GIB67_003735 [Kingdonia uniflora]
MYSIISQILILSSSIVLRNANARVTPSEVATLMHNKINELPADQAMKFFNACICAADGVRKHLETDLRKPGLVPTMAFIQRHFYHGGRVNLTVMSLIGHCIMASGIGSSHPLIAEYSRKIKGPLIWKCDIDFATISVEQKTILKEKASHRALAEAREAGKRIVADIVKRGRLRVLLLINIIIILNRKLDVNMVTQAHNIINVSFSIFNFNIF